MCHDLALPMAPDAAKGPLTLRVRPFADVPRNDVTCEDGMCACERSKTSSTPSSMPHSLAFLRHVIALLVAGAGTGAFTNLTLL